MRARHARLRPFTVSGRKTIAAIMLVFALYTGLSLVLSSRTATRSDHQAELLQVAARQRTLTERYAKEVLLGLAGSPSAAVPIAHDLVQSAHALLDGGIAPAVAGDDDDLQVPPLTGGLARLQLRQEQSLIHDLVATGSGLLAGSSTPVKLTAHERYPKTMSPLRRLTVLTGITSNVALNVAHSIADASDRNISTLVSLQRLLAALGLAVFAILSWALVTSTRRRSAHFQSLVTSTTDLVLAFAEGRCKYASNSVLRMLGCTEADILGDGISEFVHPKDKQALLEVLRTGSATLVEFRLKDSQRGWRAVEANVTDLRSDRDVRGIVLNARDVTERNRVETQRERQLEQEMRANERLREIDGLKDEFVALVSHEVRTPLTSIMGYLELLSEQELTEEQRLYTNIIERNSDRLLRLTSDLLFIAQIDDGQLTVEHDSIDLGTTIVQALAAAAPTATMGDVELSGDETLSLPITGDEGRLAQLLDNLISNAIKFTPAGGTVEVAAGLSSESVWIEVRDSGIGIDESDQERLFNKFFRTGAATKASIQGTGLGLAISKAIVEAHGGSIRVESAEGKGSTFRVELPLAHTASLVSDTA
jgi:PAS domain S-box-containing protein